MKLLVADIGGTNMRAAIATRGLATLTNPIKEKTNSQHLGKFLSKLKDYNYEQAVIAAAGPSEMTSLQLTNADVRIKRGELQQALGAPVTLINDVAAACASLKILDQLAHEVINKTIDSNKKVALISIGTGLGVAIQEEKIIATEQGHSKDPETGKEYEDLLSGSAIKQTGLSTHEYLKQHKKSYLQELNEFMDLMKKRFDVHQFALTGGVVKYNHKFFTQNLKREENTIIITQPHIGLIGAAQWN